MSVDFTDYGVEFRAPLLPSPPEEYNKLAFEVINSRQLTNIIYFIHKLYKIKVLFFSNFDL